MKFIFKPTLIFFLTLFSISSETDVKWREKSEKDLLTILEIKNTKQLDNYIVQLWTVTPGVTVTTAFGHSALRIFEKDNEFKNDYYIDFGVYDASPKFFYKFLRGEAIFYGNIVPTSSAFQTWDTSGRGILSTELILDYKQKESLFQELKTVFLKSKEGYYYENFTNNCVTFLRDTISKGLNQELKLTKIDEDKNTWRSRVQPYSKQIFWLNIEETLLFDHDTDKIRNSKEIIYLPEDLYRALKESNIETKDKVILRDRWGNQTGKSGTIWRIIFYTILIFSLPIALIIPFEKIANILFGLVSGFSGIFASAVFFVTSFKFMDETISWLIVSPIDFIFLKKFENWNRKKIFFILISIRVIMLLAAIILKFTLYKQEIGNLLFLSSMFYLFFILKNKKNLLEVFKK